MSEVINEVNKVEHDKLCPLVKSDVQYPKSDPDCACDFISQVRRDEAKLIADKLDAVAYSSGLNGETRRILIMISGDITNG